jgi:hypothetical protein
MGIDDRRSDHGECSRMRLASFRDWGRRMPGFVSEETIVVSAIVSDRSHREPGWVRFARRSDRRLGCSENRESGQNGSGGVEPWPPNSRGSGRPIGPASRRGSRAATRSVTNDSGGEIASFPGKMASFWRPWLGRLGFVSRNEAPPCSDGSAGLSPLDAAHHLGLPSFTNDRACLTPWSVGWLGLG